MQTIMRPVCLVSATAVLGVLLASAPFQAQAPAGQAARPAAPPPANACASPANKIVAENCKPGNYRTEWDINSDGDASIQGFASEMSVSPGENIDFKVNTISPRYRIDIFRMGWYGGNGARLVQAIRPSVPLPQTQPPCMTAGQRLLDCGNWATSASWRVPADAVSGVYVARLVREDDAPQSWRSEGTDAGMSLFPPALPHAYGALGLGKLEDAMKEKRASHIIFIVRDDAGQSAILVQMPDPTWQAFNRYGGASLYFNAGGGARAFAVSYNRPMTNRASAVADQFFSAEYPLVRWLERNGYDVSYFAGVDSDRRGAEIREHRVFMSAGHDAFWTSAQRANIEAARDAGVHLAFMGGGVSMWKARYVDSVDGAKTPHRTLASYRETLAAGKLDPIRNVWTGTWRDK
jgi:hypothetical protein